MESTTSILINYIKEFIPANKGHVLALGLGLIAMSLCLMVTAVTSGLKGELVYMILHPGVTGFGILSGIALVIAGVTMKLPVE